MQNRSREARPLPVLVSWVALVAAAGARGEEPMVSARLEGDEVVVSIGIRSLTPRGEAIFPAVQLESSGDLDVWGAEGDPIPQRLGGVEEMHEIRLDTGIGDGRHFVRVAWSVDLSGVDLSGRDLGGADLRGADLRGAALEDADLRGADLRGADLRGASLRGARLVGAVLWDAATDGLVIDRLGGDPADPISSSIPMIPYVPLESDFSLDHPDLPGLPLSHNTVVMTFKHGATLADANGVFAAVDVQFITGVPSETADGLGVAIVKLATSDHPAMEAALAALRADPAVDLASCDVLLGAESIPKPNGGNPPEWTWDTASTDGNWGLEISRVPQMWNLNDGLLKRGHTVMEGGFNNARREALRAAGKLTVIGVIDSGFHLLHPDLELRAWPGDTPPKRRAHGTKVAGVIGGFFDNGTGVDGINPFSYLVVSESGAASIGPLAGRPSWAAGFLLKFRQMVEEFPDVRAVNMSLGYNWYLTGSSTNAPINPATNLAVPILTSAHGGLFHALLQSMQNPPLLIAAAGNDNDSYPGHTILAKDGSPMANAGIEWQNPNVVVVEAVYPTAEDPTGTRRSPYSNQSAHLSAPGGLCGTLPMLSATDPLINNPPPLALYASFCGTSMATPHVTGLAGFLLALDPTLTNEEVRELITFNARPAGGDASDRIDAFTAAMAIDVLRGDDAILKMLVDIDDGTPDGNTRVDPGTATAILDEDADGDGGMGDGRVDMADFRRYRDWLLDIHGDRFTDIANDERVRLDGAADHPKRDINGNGLTPATEGEEENIFPRGDFNGDGVLSTFVTDTEFVPGFDSPVTDIEVLAELFDDPVYSRDDINLLLIQSFDLHVLPGRGFEEPGVAAVRTSIRIPDDDSVYKEYLHAAADDVFVYTIPYDRNKYIARAVALNAEGIELTSSEKEIDLSSKRYGHDEPWEPNFVAELIITVTFPEGTPLKLDESNPLRVRVEVVREDGSFAPVAGASLDVIYAGDDTRELFGVTDEDGYFEDALLADAGIVTLQIEASHADGSAGYFFRDYEAEPASTLIQIEAVIMVDQNDFDTLFDPPSVGPDGGVVFYGEFPQPGGGEERGVYRWRSGSLDALFTGNADYEPTQCLPVRDAAGVAYFYGLDSLTLRPALLVHPAMEPYTVFTASGSLLVSGEPIGVSGSGAFLLYDHAQGPNLYADSPFVTGDALTGARSLIDAGGGESLRFEAAINAQGKLAFVVDRGDGGPYSVRVTSAPRFDPDVNGMILDITDLGEFYDIGGIGIDGTGAVYVNGFTTEGVHGIFQATGSDPLPAVQDGGGLLIGERLAVTDDGHIAYFGDYEPASGGGGGGSSVRGIFAGPNPLAHKVVAVDDTFVIAAGPWAGTWQITDISDELGPGALNDSGTLVFQAEVVEVGGGRTARGIFTANGVNP